MQPDPKVIVEEIALEQRQDGLLAGIGDIGARKAGRAHGLNQALQGAAGQQVEVHEVVVSAQTSLGAGILVQHGITPFICYAALVLTAWALSMSNGWLIRGLRIPAIIITLAGLAFYRGLALVIADLGIARFSGNISVADEAYHAPGKLYPVWILLAVIVIALLWEMFALTPRRWLALGSSEEACSLMGLYPNRILQSSFCVSGIFR